MLVACLEDLTSESNFAAHVTDLGWSTEAFWTGTSKDQEATRDFYCHQALKVIRLDFSFYIEYYKLMRNGCTGLLEAAHCHQGHRWELDLFLHPPPIPFVSPSRESNPFLFSLILCFDIPPKQNTPPRTPRKPHFCEPASFASDPPPLENVVS